MRLTPLKITLIYLISGGLWILFSDTFIGSLVRDVETLSRLQSYKGGFYILVTGGMLYALIRRFVSQIRAQEKTVREHLRFMNTLQDTIPSPVFYKDAKGRYQGCNISFARQIMGVSKREIIGRTVYDFPDAIPGELADIYHEKDLAILENPGVLSHENRVLCADGQYRTYFFTKAPFSDDAGKIAGIVGVMIDISERKQAETDLKQSHALLMSLINSIRDLIFYKDKKGVYMGCNDAFTQFAGAERERIIGSTDLDLFPQELAVLFQKQDRLMLASGAPLSNEEWIVYPDGRRVLVETLKTPYYGPDGELIGLIGVSRDITARKQADEEKRRFENQLSQARKMESLGTLAGGIAHDFNNILSAIIGYTEITLADISGPSHAKENLKKVLQAGERARALVQQILAFSRQSEADLKPVRMRDIVTEVLRLLRASLPSTIEIQEDIRSDGEIMADPTQIHQVMMNLCTNAAHAMSESGGKLGVTLTNVLPDEHFADSPPGHYLRLTVSDTGHGIPRTVMERIFDPFFTTKKKGEGTGMGLAVVHGIVKGYGGTITAYSEPGSGATFDVFIPALTGKAAGDDDRAPLLLRGNERILFVDDEPYQVDMARQMLTFLGYHAEAMTDSTEALERIRMAPDDFDLIITDMTMPRMTGDVLASRILAIRPDMPVILCTGYNERITDEKARDLGVRAFILKPISMRELAQVIRKAFE
ncbi:hypothetical protein DENIS_4576 [Desulfonema ishimotonii]|uniref:histidine kinase n=1 Tax=Desulfonema ishimotonii TaxID=45657 RepID=A0A401G2V8_9BACT|nr:PAS domain-containing protein [Desulfonema ishimotonii]GBC63578.1 hypothetical protein DENIS_4576 [Desulfonema ishimotonii]